MIRFLNKLRNKQSILELFKTFNTFSSLSSLKPNLTKFEVAGIYLPKGVKLAVYDMKSVDLTSDALKVLGVHFFYIKSLQNDMNFLKAIMNIQSVLKMWRMRNLTREGRIIIFKTLASSKII